METSTAFFEAVALWSQVVGSVAFLVVLILAFRKYLIPAVVANQKARNAEITDAETRVKRIKTECAHARASIEEADRDAIEIRSRAETVAHREHDHLIAEAKADGERVIHNAEGERDRARMAARDRLRIEFIEKALAKARTEAPARVTDEINHELVDLTVADLARGNL